MTRDSMAGAPSAAGVPIRVDVAVVGAGPAGLAAACGAAEAGASVLVVDQAAAPGGQVWRRDLAATGPSRLAGRWLERFAASGARLFLGTTVVDALPGPAFCLLAERAEPAAGAQRPLLPLRPLQTPQALLPLQPLQPVQALEPLQISADRLVIATGARERFLPYPGWTLPNVVGVGGAQAMLKSGASCRGRRVVVAGSGPLLLPVAAALARAGARIAVVAEQAPAGAVMRFAAGLGRHPGKLAQAAAYRAAFWTARYRFASWVSAARGISAVSEAVLTDGSRTWCEPCDLLACAYGLVPNVELARLLGCALGGDACRAVRVDPAQQTSVPGVYCAGEPGGVGGLDLALLTGEIAGMAAAGVDGADPVLRLLERRRDREQLYVGALERGFRLRPELLRLATPETLVCRCEDVPLARLEPGWTARQAKLYTRAGMGPCQGRICGPALELLCGWDELDTVRPPLEPVALGTLGGAGAADQPSIRR